MGVPAGTHQCLNPRAMSNVQVLPCAVALCLPSTAIPRTPTCTAPQVLDGQRSLADCGVAKDAVVVVEKVDLVPYDQVSPR